jgi:MATE family multidrug resistance protein
VLNVMAMVFMVPLGLATGAAVRVGRAYGARDSAGVARAGWVAFSLTCAFVALIGLIIWPNAALVASAYTANPVTLVMAVPAVALACLMLVPDSLQVVAAQALRSRGDVWLPTGTHLTSYILVMMPLAWWLAIPRGLGIMGLVWAILVASVLSGGLLLARFWMLSRRDAAMTEA